MCGIAGAYLLRPDQLLDPEALAPMISLLAHRGPDDWGYYLDERRRVMLLHARLSIVDLEGGRQPLANEDGSVWVTCNGELYDFQRLARELEARGHRFRTRSDTEVLVHLYEEYGEEFVEHLRGEFALALYDRQRQRFYLVRDRFGTKPLYYTILGDTLLFASEIKALLSYPSMLAELNGQYVFHMLSGVLLPGETLFRGVRQVEPGCLLKIAGGRPQRVQYWDLSFPRLVEEPAIESHLNEQDAVEEFRRLFEEAVALRLHGDVEVGAYLSGGIDSAAVALTMARRAGRPVKAFTVSFGDPSYDELTPARAIAEEGDLEHHVLRVGPGGLAEHFARSLWHSEIPVLNSHGTAKFLLSGLAADHVKAVLTGQGADELLAGYDQFKHQLLLEAVQKDPKNRSVRSQLEQFRPSSGNLGVLTRAREYPDYGRVTELFGSYPYPVIRPILSRPRVQRLLARDFREAMAAADSVTELAQRIDRSRLAGLSPTAATQYLLFKTDLPGYILNTLTDRQEMAHSLEGRLPFLDHKLVEFACRLPLRMKLNAGSDKYILRRAMARVASDAVCSRPKKLFLAPSRQSLELDRPGNPLVARYLTTERIRDVGIFDPHRLKLALLGVRCFPKGSYRHTMGEALTMVALSLHIIHDLFCRSFHSSAERYSRSDIEYRLCSPAAVASRASSPPGASTT